MNKKKLSRSGSLQSSVTSVLAALLCILIGLLVGFLVLVAINPAHAWAMALCASSRAASTMPPTA